jgi:hypothetical protein
MHPNPKLKTTILRSVVSYLGNGLLHSYGTLDGINSTRKLGQDTVASRICDPSAVLGDQPVHHLAMARQGAERLNLVVAHQARIPCHVSREDRRQPSLDPVLLPIHGTLSAIPARILRRVGRGVQPTSTDRQALTVKFGT